MIELKNSTETPTARDLGRKDVKTLQSPKSIYLLIFDILNISVDDTFFLAFIGS